MEIKKLLVVDDEADIADVIRRCGERVHYDVDVAKNGVEGFAQAQNGTYQLICMDIRMPMWNGVGAATAINLLNPEQKILIISGYLDDKTIKMLEKYVNIVGCMRKPFDICDLMTKLEEIASQA